MPERKSILLRLDPAVYDALAKWAGDDLRSTTAHIELLLRRALADAGRMPRNAGGLPRRGRPPKEREDGEETEPTPEADGADEDGADGADDAE